MAAMTMLLPPVSGRIVGRRGGRIPLVIAGVALTASCLMLVGLSATTPFSWLFTAYVVFGIGFGFVNAPITTAAVSGMPRAQAGVAAAIASTSRQIGQTLGVAVVGSLVSVSLQGTNHVDFALASRAGWWVLAGCGAMVLILGAVATTSWARDTARRTAESLNPEFLEGDSP
jgi:MFS family permease